MATLFRIVYCRGPGGYANLQVSTTRLVGSTPSEDWNILQLPHP